MSEVKEVKTLQECTLQNIFSACNQLGDFPNVVSKGLVRHATSNIGKVVEVNARGIAVYFEGMKWNTWFSWENGTDHRSHYTSELSIVASYQESFDNLREEKERLREANEELIDLVHRALGCADSFFSMTVAEIKKELKAVSVLHSDNNK